MLDDCVAVKVSTSVFCIGNEESLVPEAKGSLKRLQEEAMKAHDLAKKLLALPDYRGNEGRCQ